MRNRKILLISANVFKEPYPVYPLGISYIDTYLKRNLQDFIVETYDMNFGSLDDLGSQLKLNDYGYVGLSLRNIDDNNIFSNNSFIAWYKQVADCIRANSKSCLILGGAGFSIFPEILFEELSADFGIKGEGESSLLQLLTALEREEPLDAIDGLVYEAKNGEIIVNDRKHYEHCLTMEIEDKWLPFYWEQSGMMNIQTKRGCPFHCIYCSYPVIEGRKVRTLDTTEVVESLKRLYFQNHVNYVFFTDSVFNIDKEYNKELCEKIIESGVKINWGAYFSPRNLSWQDLLLYKHSGLTHIEFGTESFSDQQLANYNKGFTWNDVLEKSHLCDDLGIFYAHFMILAGYGETEESLNETYEHSKLLNNTVIFPYIGMRIYPHTSLYDIAIKDGIISGVKDLLSPKYYVSPMVDASKIQEKAKASGAKWIFPGEGSEEMIARFRKKKRRGPLWEYLRY